MLKVSFKYLKRMEEEKPGFVDLVISYENAILPRCPYCLSWHTAQVTAGFVSTSFAVVRATTKLMFDFQNRGRLYCNECKEFFTPKDYEGPIWWHKLIDVEEEEN